jgi:hypothetical protein
MSAPEGPCGLCLKLAVLQKSHLLPAAGYKLVRSGPDESIASPILITPKKSFSSDKQIAEYFLCRDCEQRFSTHGESYVMSQCARQNGNFPLRDLLRTASPLYDLGDYKVFEVTSILGEKTEQYLYFGASVFWRAAAHTWKGSGETIKIDLGEHKEQLHRYLLGEAGFPEDGRLIVQVSSENDMTDVAVTPFKANDCHKFYFFGLLFTLAFDKGATQWDDIALNSSKGKFMLLSPWKFEPLYQGLRARVHSQALASDLLERIRNKAQ